MLLNLIGTAAGSAAMYQAMASLGHAAESPYSGPIKLDGNPRGASVLILGAGLAGLVAAYELKKAGYRVQVLEYHARAGGRTRCNREMCEIGAKFDQAGVPSVMPAQAGIRIGVETRAATGKFREFYPVRRNGHAANGSCQLCQLYPDRRGGKPDQWHL